MAVTIVTIDGAVSEVEVKNASFNIITEDGQKLFPALVTNLEIENSGKSNTISVDCGDTERRKTASGAWVMRVEGIVTSSSRSDNLSMERLKDLASMDTIRVSSGLFSGRILVSNVIISAPEEVTEIQTNRTNGREKAWAFSMVLGEENSE